MEYWVSINNNQVGPMSLDEVIALNPTADMLVWHPGMPDWEKAVNLPELAHLFMPKIETESQQTVDEKPEAEGDFEVSEKANITEEQQPQKTVPKQEKSPNPDKPCPPTYLLWAVLVTVLCCAVGGIPAIIYASQVKSKYDAGDYAGAEKASEKAAWWLIIAFVIGLIYQPFSVVFALL